MQIASRITDATISSGAGALTLLGTALPGTKSVLATFAAGTSDIPLTVIDSITNAWVSASWTLGANGVITPDFVVESSANNGPVSFPQGTPKTVFLDPLISLFERSIPYSPSVPLDGRYDMGVHVVAGPIAFVPIGLNQRRGSYCKVTLVMDGSSATTFPGFTQKGSAALLTTAGASNDIEFAFNGVVATYTISHAAATGVPPGAVTNVTIGSATSSSLSVAWPAPLTGDAPISYSVAYRVTGSGAFTPFATGLSGTSTTITSLAPSTSYDVLVTPSNAVGIGTAGTATGSTTGAAASLSLDGSSLALDGAALSFA